MKYEDICGILSLMHSVFLTFHTSLWAQRRMSFLREHFDCPAIINLQEDKLVNFYTVFFLKFKWNNCWNKKPCILYILGSLPHNINDLYEIVLHYINKMEFLKLPCRGHRIYVFNVLSVFIFFITCVQNQNHPPDIWFCTGCLLPHT